MALSRAAGLCRLALRSQWAAVRLLSAVAAGEPFGGDDVKPGRLIDTAALRRERALRPPAERTPPALPFKAHSTPRPTPEQLQLNKVIGACASAEAVFDLVLSRLAVLNGVNAATALMTFSRLVTKDEASSWLSGDARFAQLLSAAASRFGQMGPQELSNALYACGQLGITPPDDWLQCLWRANGPKLPDFVPQGLSNTLYACGQLGITPPVDWLQRYWHHSALRLGDFREQDLSNTLYACGQLGITPPDHWLQGYWQACALKLVDFIPQGLSNTIYACGELGITPPTDWLLRFWHAGALKLGACSPQDFSNMMYACGQLNVTPPDDWLKRYWHASALKLGDFVPQGLSNTLYACGQLGITPPVDWLQRYWHQNALRVGDFNEQDFSNTLYACGQLGITPPADFLQRYWHACGPRLGRFVPQGLSNTLLACAQLNVTPPADWLQRFSDSFERSLPDADFQSLANAALALAMLRLWELPLWPGLWERLCKTLHGNSHTGSRGSENWLDAQQLYQAYQAALVERPGLLPLLDPELLAAARKRWIDGLSANGLQSSVLHANVSACLTRMGITHANERWCERAERSIDIAIEGAGAPVAVEVDGPSHFLLDGRLNGSTLLRNRMLAAHGWRVILVDFREWDGQTHAQREDYLHNLLP